MYDLTINPILIGVLFFCLYYFITPFIYHPVELESSLIMSFFVIMGAFVAGLIITIQKCIKRLDSLEEKDQ